MSSVHKQAGKPNWFCAFYDPEGFRRFRSTGTDNLRVAKSICLTLERAATLAKQGKLSNEKAMKMARETCEAVKETHGSIVADRVGATLRPSMEEFIQAAGGELVTFSIRAWLDSWWASLSDASKATRIEYRRILDEFIAMLGARASRPLTTLQPAQVEQFKAQVAKRVAPSTVNKAIKVIKAAFAAAVAKRYLEFSPAQHVEAIATDESSRRPFTSDELKKLMSKVTGEWRTMVLLGYYTGLRLRDCAQLTWKRIDLLKGAINVPTQKTGRWQDIPIAEPLLIHLNTLAGDKPDAPLCPTLSATPAPSLSNKFYRVMVKAGIVEKRSNASKGKGRDGKREASEISFHSLRHNTTSALKSSGASNAVAMDLIGHESEAVSRNYTKIGFEAKREAISKLPDITQ